MKVAFGIIYTPFIPGSEELRDALEYARRSLPSCITILDASDDALTILDATRDAKLYYIIGASNRIQPGTYRRIELEAHEAIENPYTIVEDIRASLEGSLDPLDLARALVALISAEGRAARIIVYACGMGGCGKALDEALREAKESIQC